MELICQSKKILPPSLHLIQNNAFHYQDVSIGGARLWDTDEYNFDAFITSYPDHLKNGSQGDAKALGSEEEKPDRQKIFNQENLGV